MMFLAMYLLSIVARPVAGSKLNPFRHQRKGKAKQCRFRIDDKSAVKRRAKRIAKNPSWCPTCKTCMSETYGADWFERAFQYCNHDHDAQMEVLWKYEEEAKTRFKGKISTQDRDFAKRYTAFKRTVFPRIVEWMQEDFPNDDITEEDVRINDWYMYAYVYCNSNVAKKKVLEKLNTKMTEINARNLQWSWNGSNYYEDLFLAHIAHNGDSGTFDYDCARQMEVMKDYHRNVYACTEDSERYNTRYDQFLRHCVTCTEHIKKFQELLLVGKSEINFFLDFNTKLLAESL